MVMLNSTYHLIITLVPNVTNSIQQLYWILENKVNTEY